MSTRRSGPGRLDFVDVARGFAVVFMIWWHTAHGWLVPEVQSSGSGSGSGSGSWLLLRTVGGLAAPLFVGLAGVGIALQTAALRRRGLADSEIAVTQIARGLQIVVSGYALRLFMWAIDGGGVKSLGNARVWLPLAVGYLVVYGGLERRRQPRALLSMGLAMGLGLGLSALGIWQASVVVPLKLVSLLRIDVLQAIGASIVVLAVVATRLRAPVWLLVLLALAVTLATEYVARAMPGPLPEALAGYLGKWQPPPGKRPMTLFPLFPWAAHALAGSAIGALLDRASQRGTLVRDVSRMAVVGLIVGAAMFETLPHMHVLFSHAQFLVQPARVLQRVALVLAVCGISFAIARASALAKPLLLLGRASMFVYWVHLEFAFGLAAGPLHGKLGLGAWCVGFFLLTSLMVGAAWIRVHGIPRATEQIRRTVKPSATNGSN